MASCKRTIMQYQIVLTIIIHFLGHPGVAAPNIKDKIFAHHKLNFASRAE